MRKLRFTRITAFLVLLALVTGPAFALFSENSRQGVKPISVTPHQVLAPPEAAPLPGLALSLLELVADSLFVSKDPIGFLGGFNLWSYANQNPVNFTDSWGLETDFFPPIANPYKPGYFLLIQKTPLSAEGTGVVLRDDMTWDEAREFDNGQALNNKFPGMLSPSETEVVIHGECVNLVGFHLLGVFHERGQLEFTGDSLRIGRSGGIGNRPRLPPRGTPERNLIENARQRGIQSRQRIELDNIRAGGVGSGVWTTAELAEIRKTGRFPADAQWHHNPTVANRPDLAGDPNVVHIIRGGRDAHRIIGHEGNFQKPYE